MLTTEDIIWLSLAASFGLWLAVMPSGFQALLNLYRSIFITLRVVPKDFQGFTARPIFVRAFGLLWFAIVASVIIRGLAGTLPAQPG